MSGIKPSNEQLHLAALLGVQLDEASFDVAAAQLLDAVAIAIGYEPSENSSERQREFAASLGVAVSSDSKRVASAKIGDALFARNQHAIDLLGLKPGDKVIKVDHVEFNGETQTLEREFVTSSIQPNGRVFFKGGNGQGAWPTQLRRTAH